MGAKGDLLEVKAALDSQVREAPARVGSIAPKDVTIKAGPTGIDPAQTSFFQKLNIATKIVKAKIEIINDFQIISEDDVLTACSLGSGYVVPSSAPHLILHSFRMLAAVTYATDYSFPEAAAMKASASAGPAVAAKAEVAETKEKVASVKSKSSEGVGGFFGDEEEDY